LNHPCQIEIIRESDSKTLDLRLKRIKEERVDREKGEMGGWERKKEMRSDRERTRPAVSSDKMSKTSGVKKLKSSELQGNTNPTRYRKGRPNTTCDGATSRRVYEKSRKEIIRGCIKNQVSFKIGNIFDYSEKEE
jgi:hypothetical protein